MVSLKLLMAPQKMTQVLDLLQLLEHGMIISMSESASIHLTMIILVKRI